MSSLVKPLEWDSEFFGVSIARVIPDSVDELSMQSIETYCTEKRIACLYALVHAENTSAIHLLESKVFRLMDIRMTLTRKIDESSVAAKNIDFVVRPSENRDVEQLRAIARVSHVDSRYYSDTHFPRLRCDDLYARWIEKSCKDYADIVLVAEWNGKAVGYITCDVNENGIGQIGLFAVDAAARGRGIGSRLILESIAWFHSKGCGQVDVVTQGCNTKAQQAYQKAGFVTSRVQLWFHKWF